MPLLQRLIPLGVVVGAIVLCLMVATGSRAATPRSGPQDPIWEFLDCAGSERPSDNPGLALTVCDPIIIGDLMYNDREIARLDPPGGSLDQTTPLEVEELDPQAPPVIQVMTPSSHLLVWASVSLPNPDWLTGNVSLVPQAVLFRPVTVTPDSRLEVKVTGTTWTLTDASGRLLGSGHPRDWMDLLNAPRVRRLAGRRRGSLLRVDFALDRGYDGQALFFATSAGAAGQPRSRQVRPHLSYGSTRGWLRYRLPHRARTFRLETLEDGDQHSSRTLRLK